MPKDKYTIDYLIEKFTEHAISSDKENNKLRKEFIRDNPGEPVPENVFGDFNLAKALAAMCREIKKVSQE